MTHDAYIAKARPFARPILKKVRALFHEADPRIRESIKWGCPHFELGGIVGFMAAFKEHAAFGVWLRDKKFSRLRSVADLPSKAVALETIRAAIARRERGETLSSTRKARPQPKPPADLLRALRANTKANASWTAFTPGARKEYVMWVGEAKRPETRAERLATTVKWVAMGRKRNWKYE